MVAAYMLILPGRAIWLGVVAGDDRTALDGEVYRRGHILRTQHAKIDPVAHAPDVEVALEGSDLQTTDQDQSRVAQCGQLTLATDGVVVGDRQEIESALTRQLDPLQRAAVTITVPGVAVQLAAQPGCK